MNYQDKKVSPGNKFPVRCRTVPLGRPNPAPAGDWIKADTGHTPTQIRRPARRRGEPLCSPDWTRQPVQL